MIAPAGLWPGCHGVRLRSSADLGLGCHAGVPLATVDVLVDSVPAQTGKPVWSVRWPDQAGGPADADRDGGAVRLHRDETGALTLEIVDARRLRVAVHHGAVTVTPPFDGIQAQLVASFGLPMVVEELPSVLVLHAAAAAAPDGRIAVVIAGAGGAGKSSALIALMAAGWAPISEDVCVVDLTGLEPRVWPGPPWVRVRHDEAGPAGMDPVFRTSEKTAWGLGARQPDGAVPVGVVLSLEPPGGEETHLSSLSPPAAIEAVAGHAVWLGEHEQRARHLFGPVAAVASRVPVVRLRLPHDPDWVDQLTALLDPLAEGSPLGGRRRLDTQSGG